MKIWTFEGGYDNNCTYIISDKESAYAAIIDAAIPINSLLNCVRSQQLTPTHLLLTHSHSDHTAYIDSYINTFPELIICLFGGQKQFPNQQRIRDNDAIKIGNFTITVIHTPGHYPDSVCYYVEPHTFTDMESINTPLLRVRAASRRSLVNKILFTGDTLFVGRTGRTIGYGSDVRQLYRSVYNKIFSLPEDTIIYPGHNYGSKMTISLADNRKTSPLLQANNEKEFFHRMEQYEHSRHTS